MLSHIVGQQNLLEAIRQYSKNYAYKNVGSEELFDLTSAKSLPRNIDVKTVMATWTSQAGVPLITVTRNYKRGTLEVKQVSESKLNRFFFYYFCYLHSRKDSFWMINYSIRIRRNGGFP